MNHLIQVYLSAGLVAYAGNTTVTAKGPKTGVLARVSVGFVKNGIYLLSAAIRPLKVELLCDSVFLCYLEQLVHTTPTLTNRSYIESR